MVTRLFRASDDYDPRFSLFYAGMVSHKNVVSTLLQNFAALALVGVLWIVVGYSLVFSAGTGFLGGFDYVFLKGLSNAVQEGTGVPMLAFVAFQMMFAIITPALITGSIAERVEFKAWLFILGLWSLFVYAPVAHWVWGPGGWIMNLGALDFAGGLVVHITAGFSGLVAAMMFGRRSASGTLPNDIPMIMLGAALLWFGWFGFNAGSAITSGALASSAFIVTFIGAASAFLVWMLVDWIRSGKPTAVGASIGLVVGLVSVTPTAGYVTVESAFIIGGLAAALCNLAAGYIKKITHLDDTLDVFACHGLGGVIGSILTGVFATKTINPNIANEGILISGDPTLFIANLTATVAVAAFAMIMTYVLIKVVNAISPIRVSNETEQLGLDTLHGEKAKAA
jgi:ammonium transporter, Amt family